MNHQADRGKLIVLEGIEGCGKTTQTEMLCRKLTNHMIAHYRTSECSRGPIGQVIRHWYLSGKRKGDPRIINRLYAADRLDHISNEEDGMLRHLTVDRHHVITDRYYLSSFAYDTYMHLGTDRFDDALQEIIMINRPNMELLRPDVTIYLKVDPQEAYDRVHQRTDLPEEIYDGKETIYSLAATYDTVIPILVDTMGENIVTVDGHGDPMVVADRVWDVVKKFITI